MAGWWSHTWNKVRSLMFEEEPQKLSHGADYAGGYALPSYDVQEAMASYARFPWLVSCLNVMAVDLSALPLRVMKGRGKSATVLDEHPFYTLIEQPSSNVTGLQFRRQAIIDLGLSGNWYALALYSSRALPPVGLRRMHPERVNVVPDEYEGLAGYRYDFGNNEQAFIPSDVLHARMPSYEAGPEGLYGQGIIRALREDLNTDLRAQRLASSLAKRGRPDIILSPKDEMTQWNDAARKAIRESYEKMLTEGSVLVTSTGVETTLTSWSPRDMEFEKVRLMARDTVLAATGVPPSRVGLPTANYATSREQSINYWTNLQGLAVLLDEQYTKVIRKWDPTLRVYHDFSKVEALQYGRNERLDRVTKWVFLGATPAAAAAYESFDDSPLEDVAVSLGGGVQPPTPDEAPTKAAATPPLTTDEDKTLTRLFLVPDVRAYQPPVAEDERATLWRAHIKGVHQPTERALGLATQRVLRAQSTRLAERLGRVMESQARATGTDDVVVRTFDESVFNEVWNELEETGAVRLELRPVVREALIRSFGSTANQTGLKLTWDPARLRDETERVLGMLVVNVSDETKRRVREVIQAAIRDGSTINEIQDALRADPAFSASRALRVARTESTRSVSAGQTEAIRAANDEGVKVRKQWLTARDGEVRDEHAELDGQTVDAGENFKVPSTGDEADAPGDFDKAHLNVNCRCSTVPVVED